MTAVNRLTTLTWADYLGRTAREPFSTSPGIHAMGTLGAATYLCGHVAELYEQVKNRRWSVLVECRYDPGTRAIQVADAITTIYS